MSLFLQIKFPDQPAAIILVDSALSNIYISIRHGKQIPIVTAIKPLLGGTEDFRTPPADTDASNETMTQSTAASMFDELIRYWSLDTASDAIDPESHPLAFVSYIPLRIIAAEWVNYMAAMCFAMKQYEYPPSICDISSKDINQITLALISLESWSRRVLSSKAYIDSTVSMVRHQQDEGLQDIYWRALLEDYEYVRSSLIDHANQIENVSSLVCSYLHLAESRRAFGEAKNISRLTVLALFFVPLGYVSSLFSMNEAVAPGGQFFWVYFIVAIPVSIFVFALASWRGGFFSTRKKLFGVNERSMRGKM